MSKPMPPHHKIHDIPTRDIARGYGGVRTFKDLPGAWIIVAAMGEPAAWPACVRVIVAPARARK